MNHDFLSKEDWDEYVNRDADSENIGYFLATKGFVNRLEKILELKDSEKLKTALINLTQNRRDLLTYAENKMEQFSQASWAKVNKEVKKKEGSFDKPPLSNNIY